MTPKLDELDYFKAWVCTTAIGLFGGLVAGALVGGLLGGVLGVAGVPIAQIRILCSVAGFLAGLPISYLGFRFMVSRFIAQKLIAQSNPYLTPPTP